MKKVLIILRGIPGCGKSTLAELISKWVCTADDYHMKDGVYDWKVENLHASHLWCQSKAERYMDAGLTPVVVANTSTTEKEIKPYYDLAEARGYTVFSVIVENRHNGMNVHGVPDEALEKMKNRFNIKL